jgi:uncharacterized protein with PQ loop repeat
VNVLREFAGIAMACCFIFCNIPQIYKIIKNKSSTDVSLSLIVMCALGGCFGILYNFLSGFAFWFFLNHAIGVVTTSVLLYVWFKYKK